jgi:hypothetical protein
MGLFSDVILDARPRQRADSGCSWSNGSVSAQAPLDVGNDASPRSRDQSSAVEGTREHERSDLSSLHANGLSPLGFASGPYIANEVDRLSSVETQKIFQSAEPPSNRMADDGENQDARAAITASPDSESLTAEQPQRVQATPSRFTGANGIQQGSFTDETLAAGVAFEHGPVRSQSAMVMTAERDAGFLQGVPSHTPAEPTKQGRPVVRDHSQGPLQHLDGTGSKPQPEVASGLNEKSVLEGVSRVNPVLAYSNNASPEDLVIDSAAWHKHDHVTDWRESASSSPALPQSQRETGGRPAKIPYPSGASYNSDSDGVPPWLQPTNSPRPAEQKTERSASVSDFVESARQSATTGSQLQRHGDSASAVAYSPNAGDPQIDAGPSAVTQNREATQTSISKGPDTPSARLRIPSEPAVQIGRIDVIVEPPALPKGNTGSPRVVPADLSSRLYLRGL